MPIEAETTDLTDMFDRLDLTETPPCDSKDGLFW